MEAHARERNSRWDREPALSAGKPKVGRLTERDIEVLKLLARYRYLPLDDIHAFVGGSLKGLSQHLSLMSRKPNLYIARPAQQREAADANHRRLIYELDERGTRVIRELGLEIRPKRRHRNFAHELMVCRIMASIELGTLRSRNLRLITWAEILSHPKTPQALKDAQRPTYIPVSIMHRGAASTTEVSADGTPFGIERVNDDGTLSYFFFPGVEADMGTEPIESHDQERSSIYKKFVAYRAIAEQRIYSSHFGFPNFFVPMIATTETRMRAMMGCLQRLTGQKGSAMFLFKTSAALSFHEKSPAPGGHMLIEPWERVLFPPLAFIN